MRENKDPFLRSSRLHQYIAERLLDHNKYLVVSPWGQRIGHISAEILSALCVSIRDKKKLVLIAPFKTVNHEIFKCRLNCSVYGEKNWKVRVLAYLLNFSLFFHYLYNGIRSNVVYCFPFLSKIIPSIFFYPMYGLEKGDYGERRVKGTNSYWDCNLYFSQNYQISLNDNQLNRGEITRKKMGIPEDSWFVCLHVREPGYTGPTNGDASISNYSEAIRYITQKGGYVIRMGDRTMTPLQTMEKVFDYALSGFKSELMDLYLVSQCRFFLGCNSGFSDLVKLFRKPTCLVNVYPMMYSTPFFFNYMYILKHAYSIKKKRFLTYKETLTTDDIVNNIYHPSEYLLIENTPEEILETVKEYILFLEDGKFKGSDEIQEEIRSVRKKHCEYMFDKGLAKDRLKVFKSVLQAQGRVANFYLEKYWENTQYLKKKNELYNSGT